MNCAPLRPEEGGTLLDWYAALFPPVMGLCGRKKSEGGLLHRLDFETNGLVLFAKNQKSLECLLAQQAEGNFVKEYSAVCRRAEAPPPSFPPLPFCPDICFSRRDGIARKSFAIESFFRPFGPGRKQVRPIAGTALGKNMRSEIARDRGGFYRTEIIGASALDACRFRFAARLRRGFRHQVRCHLAWIGFPILNDPLYGEMRGPSAAGGFLALSADGLFFDDPKSGRRLEYRIGQ